MHKLTKWHPKWSSSFIECFLKIVWSCEKLKGWCTASCKVLFLHFHVKNVRRDSSWASMSEEERRNILPVMWVLLVIKTLEVGCYNYKGGLYFLEDFSIVQTFLMYYPYIYSLPTLWLISEMMITQTWTVGLEGKKANLLSFVITRLQSLDYLSFARIQE